MWKTNKDEELIMGQQISARHNHPIRVSITGNRRSSLTIRSLNIILSMATRSFSVLKKI